MPSFPHPPRKPHWLQRVGALVAIVVLGLAGFTLLRWGAAELILSRTGHEAFQGLRLKRGVTIDHIIAVLGEPDTRLRLAHAPGSPAEEELGYRRGRHLLELTFVNDELDSWVETRPFDTGALNRAKRLATPCCPENKKEAGP